MVASRFFLALLILTVGGFSATTAAAADSRISRTALGILEKEFDLPKMTVAIFSRDVAEQSRLGGKIRFATALREALKSFIYDQDDVESPLALCAEEAWESLYAQGVENPNPEQIQKEALRMVRSLLNRPSTEISLLGLKEHPEGGESTHLNWIFSVYIPDLSDHGHWAVVDRNGEKATYNYGFN